MARYLWLFTAVVGTWVVYSFAAQGRIFMAVFFAVVNAALVWWVSPFRGGISPKHAEVMRRPQSEREVVIYWRPGCQFCGRLKWRLGACGQQAIWVNIWQDKEAAQFVRSNNEGNETVPTVVMDGSVITNPDPELVLTRLTA